MEKKIVQNVSISMLNDYLQTFVLSICDKNVTHLLDLNTQQKQLETIETNEGNYLI